MQLEQASIVPDEEPFLDINPWAGWISVVFDGGPHIGLHRVSRLVEKLDDIGDEGGEAIWQAIADDLRRRYPGRKVLLEILEAL